VPRSGSDRFALEDVLESCKIIASYSDELEFERSAEQRMPFDAILRRLFVVAEAARLESLDTQNAVAIIDWRRIKGLRNIIVHQYAGMDDEILWDIVHSKLPELTRQLRVLLDESASSTT
jgi:uncharacterized protein with HEPN domain